MKLELVRTPDGTHPVITVDGAPVAEVPAPVHLVHLDGRDEELAYDEVTPGDDGFVGLSRSSGRGMDVTVRDTWTCDGSEAVTVVRRLVAVRAGDGEAAVGLRLRLDARDARARFVAPGMAYAPDQWADGAVHSYADHRLAYPLVAAHLPGTGAALSLERVTLAGYDEAPRRGPGQSTYVQRTDVGSVGLSATAGVASLHAAWPYAETDTSSMLDAAGTPATALHPVPVEGLDVTVAYRIGWAPSADYVSTVRGTFGGVVARTRPQPTTLPVPFAASIDLRLDSAARTYTEVADGFAGFVLNFDPERGYDSQARAFGASFADHQMGGSRAILEYGFTGRQLNLAFMLARRSPAEWGERSARIVDSFVERMTTPSGWVHTLWDLDRGRPLFACGDESGTVMHYLAVSSLPGTYTRMMTEAGSDLMLNVDLRVERHGPADPRARRWWEAAERLADFFVGVQEDDGSWYRAYSPDGRPLTEGDWFGNGTATGKSATAVVVPFLLEVAARSDRPERYSAAAQRAAEYVLAAQTSRDEYRGGTLDNPNVVDKEAAFLAMRALLAVHRRTPQPELLDGARRAATLAVTWHSVWEVPAVPGTRLAEAGVRSVGWGGINPVWGVGVTDIYSLFFLEDLHALGVTLGDELFVTVAELAAHSSLQILSVPGRTHGFADVGMQPEGISFCSQGVDDGLITKGDTWGGLGWPYTAGTFGLDRYLTARAAGPLGVVSAVSAAPTTAS